uniref:IRS-type PTB domain-containing protein n=1 Tax=Tetranychus urticae TaxID=32264 RepID=T1KRP6_TETUR
MASPVKIMKERPEKMMFIFLYQSNCLHLQVYRDEKERIKSGLTKASLSLEKYIGLETGFTFDKESNTLALICQDMVLLLAFNSRETLLHWQTTIRSHLPQEHQYPVEIVSFPAKSRLTVGPSRLHIRDGCFALVSGNPPRLAGLWSLPDLRRYGVLNGKFCFEGGSSCGKGEGLHVLSTMKTGELMKAFQLASIGNLQPKRKLSIKQDKCNNLSDRISFCSSSSHSSGTSSISSGNGSYQSSLEYSTPRSAHHLHLTHHHHHHHHGSIGNERVPSGCCSSAAGSTELWYDKLKMLRSANSGLLALQDGSSICSCLSECNLLTPTSDNIGSKSTLNGHLLYPSEFDAESTSSSTNTLKQTTFNSSRQAESNSVDPKLLQKLITGHYQIPKHFLTQCQGIKNDVDDKMILNNLEMYDVPRKFQQIHFNGSSNTVNDNGKLSQPNCDQNLNTLNGLEKGLKDKGLRKEEINSLDKSTCSGRCNNGLNCDSTNQKDSISFGSDLCKECNFLVNPIVESNKATQLNGSCKGVNEEQKVELKQQLNESQVNSNSNCSHSINKSILNDDKLVDKERVNCSHKSDNLTDNLINNNYVNIDFVRSLQYYQNVGLLKKQLVNLVNPKPAVSLPDEPDKSQRLIDSEDPLVGEVNYNLMVNKSSGNNKDKDDDYLEMVPLIGESELNECEEQIYLVNQKQLNDNLLSLLTILNSSKKINDTNQSICASSSSPSPSTSSSSTNGNRNEANKLVNPLSRSLSDFTRKLKLLHEKSTQGKDKGSPKEPPYKDQTSTSCPPSPVKLSVNLDLSLPVPPPPPPPPLSYLYACRLNRSMESLIYPFTHQSSLPYQHNTGHQFYPSDGDHFDSIDHHHCQCNYDHLTSSDEDIYHASQIRVTSNSPFTCRPMSPSEIKRSISLPNGGSSVHRSNKLNCYPIVINNGQPLPDQCNQDNSQSNCHSENVNTVNLLKLNHSNGINSSCLNDLNKSTNVDHVNSLGKSVQGKSSTAITVKPRSSNEYVTLDVDRKS